MDYVGQEEWFYEYCKRYLAKNETKNEYDFLKEELIKIEEAERTYNNLVKLDKESIFKQIKVEDYRNFKNENFTDLDKHTIENLIASYLKMKYRQLLNVSPLRKEYLQYKLNFYSNVYSIKKDNDSIKQTLDTIQYNVEDLANSDKAQVLNNAEKIVLLNELGILDFLRNNRPLGGGENNLAKILSLITGEKQSTIAATLRGIRDKDEKRDPYKNIKNKEKIENIILKLGFNHI